MATTSDLLQSLIKDRDTLASNIQAKGVEINQAETFTSLANKVSQISTKTSKIFNSIISKSLPQSSSINDICIKTTDLNKYDDIKVNIITNISDNDFVVFDANSLTLVINTSDLNSSELIAQMDFATISIPISEYHLIDKYGNQILNDEVFIHINGIYQKLTNTSKLPPMFIDKLDCSNILKNISNMNINISFNIFDELTNADKLADPDSINNETIILNDIHNTIIDFDYINDILIEDSFLIQ